MSSLKNMRISVNLNEKDMIKLVLEFLHNRDLFISMLDLERETGELVKQFVTLTRNL